MNDPNNKTGHSRRRLIKALASGGAIVAAGNLPRQWNKPLVDAVMLPAHAQTSPGSAFYGSQSLEFGSAPAGDSEILAGVLDTLVPKAQAGSLVSMDPERIVEVAATIVGDGEYEFVMKSTETFPCKGTLATGEFSSFHTGTGSDGVNQSATGTGCDSSSVPANLTIEFLDGFLRAFGDIDGANFDFSIFPGGTVPSPSSCVECPSLEEF